MVHKPGFGFSLGLQVGLGLGVGVGIGSSLGSSSSSGSGHIADTVCHRVSVLPITEMFSTTTIVQSS